MQSEAFSLDSSDKVIRDVICNVKKSKIFLVKENILCTEEVGLGCYNKIP